MIFLIVSYVTRIYVEHSTSDFLPNRVELSFTLIPRSIYYDLGFGNFFPHRNTVIKKTYVFSSVFTYFFVYPIDDFSSLLILAELLAAYLHKQQQELNICSMSIVVSCSIFHKTYVFQN